MGHSPVLDWEAADAANPWWAGLQEALESNEQDVGDKGTHLRVDSGGRGVPGSRTRGQCVCFQALPDEQMGEFSLLISVKPQRNKLLTNLLSAVFLLEDSQSD